MNIIRRMAAPSALLLSLLALSGCTESETPIAPAAPRVLTTLRVSLVPALELGQITTATAAGFDQDGAPIATGAVTWSSQEPVVAGIVPTTGFILAVSPGTTQITATAGGTTGKQTLTVSTSPAIVLNEVRVSSGPPSGWVEFFNPTFVAVDVSTWTLTDGDLRRSFPFPAGSMIPARGFLVIDAASLPFVLGGEGTVHIFSRFGVQVSQASWNAQAATTVGRCPDGTGELIPLTTPTRGSTNACVATNK